MGRPEVSEEERIRRLLPRVRDVKIREAAESLLDGRSDTIPIIGPLLDALKSKRNARSPDPLVAAWSLGRARLTPDQSEATATALARNLQGWEITDNAQGWVPLPLGLPIVRNILVGVTLAVLLFGLWNPDLVLVVRSWYFWIGALLLSIVLFRSAVLSELQLEVYEEVTRALVRIGSPNSLSALAHLSIQFEGLRVGKFKVIHDTASAGMRKVITALRSCEFGEATSETIRCLARLLRDKDHLVVTDAVRALHAVGDSEAIPALETLIKKTGDYTLRDYAEEVLEVLRERKRNAEEPAKLLRAAASHQGDVSLLRPAGSECGPDTALLRPSESAAELPESQGVAI